MNKSAVVGTVVICASIAFAAQQQQSGQPQRGPSGGVQDPQGPGQPMGSLAGGGCTEGPPLSWFTTVHDRSGCYISGQWPSADLNGDGRMEYFSQAWSPQLVVLDGVPVYGDCVTPLEVLISDGGGRGLELSCLLMSEVIGEILIGTPYHFYNASTSEGMFRDMDLDGDLDMVLDAWGVNVAGESVEANFWIENTGYEHNPPLAADINHDGAVDATDLSMVLAAWTGAQ